MIFLHTIFNVIPAKVHKTASLRGGMSRRSNPVLMNNGLPRPLRGLAMTVCCKVAPRNDGER
ncbi:hypothetical protein [Candidatus Tisiphia endosymbiont of Hybos culiciformis]|uniref:hypothetical protein n=1 Tax=Candidatus Tisiphia endosymbiont of Hybos culiciformis TaxID=3139331 RepID=UPI003CCA70AF